MFPAAVPTCCLQAAPPRRPTAPIHWWPDLPDVLGGRDLQRHGTWLAASRSGRFALLTNVRQDVAPYTTSEAPSRGALVTNFLTGSQTPVQYMDSLQGGRYLPFNLVVGDLAGVGCVAYYSNQGGGEVQQLPPGVYGISNGLMGEWPKVVGGVKVFEDLLATSAALQQRQLPWPELLALLSSPERCSVEELPSGTGWESEVELHLSSRFIEVLELLPGCAYGTRSQTALAVWSDGRAEMRERYLEGGEWKEKSERFEVTTSSAAAVDAEGCPTN